MHAIHINIHFLYTKSDANILHLPVHTYWLKIWVMIHFLHSF